MIAKSVCVGRILFEIYGVWGIDVFYRADLIVTEVLLTSMNSVAQD
jgi:hypothetical protein